MGAHEIRRDGARSVGRDRQQMSEMLAVRVRSYRWKTAAILLIVAGWVVSYAVALAILQIDGAATDVHWTPSQDAVGITAFVVGIGGMVTAVVVAVRWWRRPAVRVTGQAITVYQRRPVAIPWTMIADVPRSGPGGSPDGRGRGIVLTDGRELQVRGLTKLAGLAAQRQSLPGPPAPVAPTGSPLRSWLPFPLPAAWPVPAYPKAGHLGKRRAHQLPGPALQEIKIGFPWRQSGWILPAPLFIGLMVMFPGRDGGAQSGVDVAGGLVAALVFEALAALVISCCWVTLTRTVAAGPGWLAWRPRLARRWRVLPLAHVVSTIDLQWPRRNGVRLSRADGTGLRLRNPELATGLGAVARAQLAEHPAATAEFLAAVLADASRQVSVRP